MTIRTSLPHRVRLIAHAGIPMPDGVRLSARLWLPEGAGARPVQALLKHIPHRNSDWTAVGGDDHPVRDSDRARRRALRGQQRREE